MGLFKKKEKKKQSYSLKNKLFPVSKPWGYSPQHVEDAVKSYMSVIEEQKQLIQNLKEDLAYVTNEKSKLELDYRNLQFQLSFVSVPSTSQIQEEYVQKKFENQFKQNSKNSNKSSLISEEYSKLKEKDKNKEFNSDEDIENLLDDNSEEDDFEDECDINDEEDTNTESNPGIDFLKNFNF